MKHAAIQLMAVGPPRLRRVNNARNRAFNGCVTSTRILPMFWMDDSVTAGVVLSGDILPGVDKLHGTKSWLF